MINPNDVNLLVFDLDGTILSSARPTYEAVKRAFAKLGLAVQFAQETVVEKYLGATSDDFYQAILPEGCTLVWQDVRLRVRAEYPSALSEFACTYPGVKETLERLRKRGYRLALCSNSGKSWFYAVINALDLQSYFDHLECIEDNRRTKTEIIKKLQKQYAGPWTAVIGDRIYDVEAARNTGSLAVGALHGYGGKEPQEADITITTFIELLKIFDRKRPVFGRVEQEILRRKSAARAFVVGITGIDTSGKTEFTRSLAAYLATQDHKVAVINMDDFHNPRYYRNNGPDPVENYWQRNFNLEALIRDLLIPLRERSSYSISLTLLDVLSDKYEVQRSFSFDRDTIVLFEGIFLFRQELAPYLDYKIFLDIPFEECRRRAILRDVPLYGEDILRRYEVKYWPAQRKYLEEYPPAKIADLIIDNTNWEYPVIK